MLTRIVSGQKERSTEHRIFIDASWILSDAKEVSKYYYSRCFCIQLSRPL